MKTKFLCCAAALLATAGMSAKVTLPDVLCDNMVLQQNTKVKLWGEAEPGTKISVTSSWSSETVTGKADGNGKWCVLLATPKGSYEPQSVSISDGEAVTLNNVLVGEVWLASGQSNMEMPLAGFYNCPVDGANETILHSGDYKNKIRFVRIPWVQSYVPNDTVSCKWVVANPENAPRFSATAYYFAENLTNTLNVPVGIIDCNWGGSPVESWMSRELLEKSYPNVDLSKEVNDKKHPMSRPMLMYNAMLHPMINYTLKGFIWYQGESNIYGYKDYAKMLADMVALWRANWGLGNIPFYYAEIAPYEYGNGFNPYLREAQYKAQKLISNSGMISTNDLVYDYEGPNIHPAQKEPVGKRLSYMALANTYGIKGIAARGPEYKSVEFKDGKAFVAFDNAGSGFNRMNGIRGFEVCGADRKFYPADNVKLESNGVICVSSDKVKQPVAVRYCFHDFSIGNLKNGFGLPVVPFRTDNFEK